MMANRTCFGALLPSLALVSASAFFLVGCKGAQDAIPRCAIDSELGAGDTTMDGPAMCPEGTGLSWVQIGAGTGSPISSGTSYEGANVTVNCSVHPNGSNFDVTLSGVLAGQGSISIAMASVNSDTTMVSTPVRAAFESTNGGDYVESDCTWDFGGQSTDLNPGNVAGNPLGIEAGRIWGNITCPNAFNSESNYTCLAQAELRFENCGQ
jgi:hypothetical protein